MTETRLALLIETGTVYGPPATWNVVPGTVRITWAGVVAAPPGPAGAAGVVVTSRGGNPVAGGVPAGAPVGVVSGVAAPGAGTVPTGGTGANGVGTGGVPGGGTGGRAAPPGSTPGVVGITWSGPAWAGACGTDDSCGCAIIGGGPPSPRFCCVPM